MTMTMTMTLICMRTKGIHLAEFNLWNDARRQALKFLLCLFKSVLFYLIHHLFWKSITSTPWEVGDSTCHPRYRSFCENPPQTSSPPHICNILTYRMKLISSGNLKWVKTDPNVKLCTAGKYIWNILKYMLSVAKYIWNLVEIWNESE